MSKSPLHYPVETVETANNRGAHLQTGLKYTTFRNAMSDDVEPKHSLPKELKRLREERGLSQAELARQCGVSQTTITLLESGKRGGLTLDTLIDIAIGLSAEKPVSLDELTGYDAAKYYQPAESQSVTRADLQRVERRVMDLVAAIEADRARAKAAD